MKLIALCGAPGAGKSEVQEYLRTAYDVRSVDDGHPLRDFAMRHLGLSKWHVSTQEGKASHTFFPGGRHEQVRVILGELGNKIEELLGPNAIPAMAYEWVKQDIEACGNHLASPYPQAYSLGSVRREQGHFYKTKGATVLEIVRPGHEVVNEFDRYDKSAVDTVIYNDGSLDTLRYRVDLAAQFHGLKKREVLA